MKKKMYRTECKMSKKKHFVKRETMSRYFCCLSNIDTLIIVCISVCEIPREKLMIFGDGWREDFSSEVCTCTEMKNVGPQNKRFR